MDIIAAARNTLKFPTLDQRLAQYQQTLAAGGEQYGDAMPPYYMYECGEIALPSDVVEAAMTQLATAASAGQALSPLEQLGYYLLKLKAEAEYVEPEPAVRANVTTRIVALVEAKHYSTATAESFVKSMSVSITPSSPESSQGMVIGIKVLDVKPLDMSRSGPAGALDILSVRMSLTLEVVAAYTVDVRSLLDNCRAVLKSPTEALPPTGFPLLDVTIV